MTENVFWPNEEARDKDGNKKEVTITAWDYERKRGTAMIEGRHFIEVRMVGVLTIVPEEKNERSDDKEVLEEEEHSPGVSSE